MTASVGSQLQNGSTRHQYHGRTIKTISIRAKKPWPWYKGEQKFQAQQTSCRQKP